MKIDFDRCDTITADTNIGDLVLCHPETAEILFAIGMHCLGCPASQGETLEEAAWVHGIEPDRVEKEINDYLAAHPDENSEASL